MMKMIAYGVLVLFLIVGSLAVTYYVKSKQLDSEISTLTVDLNSAEESIETLNESLESSNKIIGDLSQDLWDISEKGSMVNERVSMLEKNDEEIKRVLNMQLPASGCLLDNSCEAGSGVRTSDPRSAAKVSDTKNKKGK